jgi:hypothetical protein
MKWTIAFLTCLAGLAAGCQADTYVNPKDEKSGNAPTAASEVFAIDAATASNFLDANLQPTNAVTAEYVVANGVIVPMPANGLLPAKAGEDADLRAGKGFATEVNSQAFGPGVPWATKGFGSKLTATLVLSNVGDAVRFCRSFATTCVTVSLMAPGAALAKITLAANIPDTEMGEVSPATSTSLGVSAAVRGTGPNGLTVALTDASAVAVPFAAAAGQPFEVDWTLARGAMEGSLDYTLAINKTQIAAGNTMVALAASIVKEKGVALMWDMPLGYATEAEVSYGYAYKGYEPALANWMGTGVDLSPQASLGFAPLYVYLTKDQGTGILTESATANADHVVQAADGVVGFISALPGVTPKATVYSAAFNGDDFKDTIYAGSPLDIDQGIAGGGFYPSPSFCYSQVYPMIHAKVAAEIRQGTRKLMYAGLLAPAALPTADAGLQALAGLTGLPYTSINSQADMIDIASDYADNNVDAMTTTLSTKSFTVSLKLTKSQTFVSQMNAIITAGGAAASALVPLQVQLTASPGQKETFDATLAAVLKDILNGTNGSGQNPAPPLGYLGFPQLALGCLWGVPASAEVAEVTASLTTPHSDAIPAAEAVAPAREQAAAVINKLVMGMFANFVTQVFGPTVPASVFSLAMEVGNPASGKAPGVVSIMITRDN